MEHQELGKRKRVPRNYDYFVDKPQSVTKPKKSMKQTVTFDLNTYYRDNNITSTTSTYDTNTNLNAGGTSVYDDGMMTTSTSSSTTTLTNKRQRRNSKKNDIITSLTSTKGVNVTKHVPKSKRKGVSTVVLKVITKGMSKKMKDKITRQNNAKLKKNKKLKKKVQQPPKVVVMDTPRIDEILISYIPLKVELSKSDIACQLILSDDCLTCYGSEVINSYYHTYNDYHRD